MIWNIADHLRNLYKPHEYGEIILPLTVIKRFNDCLVPTKATVLEKNKCFDAAGILMKEAGLMAASGYNFYNISPFTFESLLNDPENIESNFRALLGGFSDNVQDVIENFEFMHQIEKMAKSGVLYSVLKSFNSERGYFGPDKISSVDTGYVFEELVRKFSESYGEEAGAQNDAMYINFKYRKNDPYYEYAMKHPIKFCKLVTRKHGKKFKFFFQITFAGTPLQKNKLGIHQTGLDIGPSTIAIVNKDKAILNKFCEEIVSDDKKIKQKQRKASRKLRLLNPQNYNEKGAIRKGKKTWTKSKKYLKLQEEIANHQRCLAARRKQLHGEMVNRIIKDSYHVSAEKLSYKAFQKLWGKSIGRSAPSMLIKLLERRLKELGGSFQEINTFKTKLSQTCLCGKVKKKALKERTHQCRCGVDMQRDLFSAYLTIFVDSKNKLDLKSAKLDYKYYLPALEKCLEELKEKKKQSPQAIVSSFGI